MTLQELHSELPRLIEGWCERRALRALRCALPYWLHNGLTDGLAELRKALGDAKGLARDELTAEEHDVVSEMISTLECALDERR